MSASADRTIRRDLRRAVGAEAIALIDAHTQALDHQVLPNLNALQSRYQNIDERLKYLERVVDQRWAAGADQQDADRLAATVATDDVARRLDAFSEKSFLQRLRWLFLGR